MMHEQQLLVAVDEQRNLHYKSCGGYLLKKKWKDRDECRITHGFVSRRQIDVFCEDSGRGLKERG